MANDKELEITVDYNELLQRAVAVLERTRISIARSISDNISNAHWEIGRLLQEKKLDSKHGAGVVQRLSIDLKQRYPKMGLSPRSLWLMKKFYCRFCNSSLKLQHAVAVLPWGHTAELMANKWTKDNDDAILYYAVETVTKGWNRDILVNAINLHMYEQSCLPVEKTIILPQPCLYRLPHMPTKSSKAHTILAFGCNRASVRIGLGTPTCRKNKTISTRTRKRFHLYW